MPEDNVITDGTESTMSLDDALTVIKELRRENAARRVTTRETTDKLKEYEDWKATQMSEAEKLKAERDAAIQTSKQTLVQFYTEKYKVPENRIKFVSGDTKEDIEEAAKTLGEPEKGEPDAKATPVVNPPAIEKPNPNLFPGARGNPIGSTSSGTVDVDSALRQQLRNC